MFRICVNRYTRKVTIVPLIILIYLAIRSWKACNPLNVYLNGKLSESMLGEYSNGAVVCDAAECAPIGNDILRKGGHAVDAAIATGLCMGVVVPYSMGLGGGHFSVIYSKRERGVFCLDARETAPQASNRTMFQNNPDGATLSGMGTGIPGEIKGYWEAHKIFGKLPWKDLFAGAIDKARHGFKVHRHLIKAIEAVAKVDDEEEPSMIGMFINEKNDEFFKLDDVMKRPGLAKTLEEIAEKGEKVFYNGRIGEEFIKDVRVAGGILTMDDLRNYNVQWRAPIVTMLRTGMRYLSIPPPGSGAIVAYILNIIGSLNMTISDIKSADDFANLEHQILEAEKFGFAQRSYLGDPRFVANIQEVLKKLLSYDFAEDTAKRIKKYRTFEPNYYGANYTSKYDHGTAHISVVDSQGNAVALTSSINLFFGARIRSMKTDIILSSTMDDFSTPGVVNHYGMNPSESNYIEPGKRPLSSMAPSIVLDENDNVRLAIGGSGGTKITTAVALVTLRHLLFRQDIKKAIDGPRLHHQLFPNTVFYEKEYPKNILDKLRGKGHATKRVIGRTAIVQGISRDTTGTLQANSDYRKGGASSGY